MEQITTGYIKEFIRNNELLLISTHSRLCVPIINRMCQKMSHGGIKFADIKVCGNLVIDGHHRYVSSLITSFGIGSVPGEQTSATEICNWKDVELEERDWDTPHEIANINRKDAEYSHVDIAILTQITSV